MHILISTIVWGAGHFRNFAQYSLPSLLAAHNIPAITPQHKVTVLLFTEARFIAQFKQMDIYQRYAEMVDFDLRALEDHGFNPRRIPSGFRSGKYAFLSICQNIVIGLSKPYDLHVFNYADCIWADGSVSAVVRMFEQNPAFALLGFGLPVAESRIKPVLERLRPARDEPITLAPAMAVDMALSHLHPETKLRNWHGAQFSHFPSYVYWPVGDEGIILRAHHQTLLAVAPTRNSAVYERGIQHGAMDSHFTSDISAHEATMHATDSDSIFIFSMYRANASSRARHDKREALQRFVSQHLQASHQQDFRAAYYMKRKKTTDAAKWQAVEAPVIA